MPKYLYIGSATREVGNDNEEGIFVLSLDNLDKKISNLTAWKSGPNPSFLGFYHQKYLLFSVNETVNGSVCSFAIDPLNGKLTLVSRVKVKGDLPCYLSVDPVCRRLLIANYGSGSLSVIPFDENGRLGECVQTIRHEGFAANPLGCLSSYDGSGFLLGAVSITRYRETAFARVNSVRQETAHAHSIVADPSGNFVLVADLGMDRIWVYHFENDRLVLNNQIIGLMSHDEPQNNKGIMQEDFSWPSENFTLAPVLRNTVPCDRPMIGHNLRPGAGPRHIAFHPNGHFIYISNELDSTVTAFFWNAKVGCLSPFQVCSTIPKGYSGSNYVAHLALTPNGQFLYVSNRGHNSLAAYSVDPVTGVLALIGNYPSLGQWPRNFCIDPDGQTLYVANQESGSVVFLTIDPVKGSLSPTGDVIKVPKPQFVCVSQIE